MDDQARQLRQLVKDAAGFAPSARLIVVAGGRAGVGTTTVAVNLAVAAARHGASVVLADADPRHGDLARLCGLPDRCVSMGVSVRAAAEVHAPPQPGPAGVRVFSGAMESPGSLGTPAVDGRLLLQRLHACKADLAVIDAGNRFSDRLCPLFEAADRILVTATPQTPAILDSYALIKTLAAHECAESIRLLVNRTASLGEAENVTGRIRKACRFFLATDLKTVGHLSDDPHLTAPAAAPAATGRTATPTRPESTAARQIRQLAQRLVRTDPRASNGGQRRRHLPIVA